MQNERARWSSGQRPRRELKKHCCGSRFFSRFRLWHYLAYTALVAVELAYYLRWQE
jgi:hypothetical protein